MTTITAETILSSEHEQTGTILTTMKLRYPLCIHAEVMTHRVFSRNASSNRAIPVQRLIDDVKNDPFVPLVWGKNQPGMQSYNPLTYEEEVRAKTKWYDGLEEALATAEALKDIGVHKQIVNRVLMPYQHINVLVSSTDWDNFIYLRDHHDAEPHIQLLAKEIKSELKKPPMQRLKSGEWHTPFCTEGLLEFRKIVSVASCASVSYETVEGSPMTFERAERIYQKLKGSPPHLSPFEHVAQAVSFSGSLGNFRDFKQLRKKMESGYTSEPLSYTGPDS